MNLSKEDKLIIVELAAQGFSYKYIAAKIKSKPMFVENYCKRNGGLIAKEKRVLIQRKNIGKYDHLIFEEINEGKNYDEYRNK